MHSSFIGFKTCAGAAGEAERGGTGAGKVQCDLLPLSLPLPVSRMDTTEAESSK
jgi:hypothetical protein